MFDLFETFTTEEWRRPGLIELAVKYSRGKRVARVFTWQYGRVSAVARDGRLTVKRRLGIVSAGLALDVAELPAVARAARHWARERDGWAGFFASSAGFPACTGAWRYWAPGEQSEWEIVGEVGAAKSPFKGKTERRPRDEPLELPAGVRVVADLWRTEPVVGVRKPQRVGLIYELPRGLEVVAERRDLCIRRGGKRAGEVYLEHGEEAFLRELWLVLGPRARGAKR